MKFGFKHLICFFRGDILFKFKASAEGQEMIIKAICNRISIEKN